MRAEQRGVRTGMGALATIGSTAPFVGLFGTVWGIMNSFIGISESQTTNLAVVAPGIAEALLATALGLVAAIPAVVIYNLFARWTAAYRARLADAAAALAEGADPACEMVRAAREEAEASVAAPGAGGLLPRIGSRLGRIEAAAGRRLAFGTGLLATIGATAPFVGLFGTVWGIMNSFIGISESRTTNLAVVAPGIAEALLATALGLVAAIPAVVLYNVFARATAAQRALLADAAAGVERLASRDLDSGRLGDPAAG